MMLKVLCVLAVIALVAARHITEDQYIQQLLQEQNHARSEFGNYQQQQNFQQQNEDNPFLDYEQTHGNLESLDQQQTAQFVDVDQYGQAQVPEDFHLNFQQQTHDEPLALVKPARIVIEDLRPPKKDQQIEQFQDLDETQNKVEQFNEDQDFSNFQQTDDGFETSEELSGNIQQQTQDIEQEIQKIQLDSQNKQIADLNQAQNKLEEVVQLGNFVQDLDQIENKIENLVVDYDNIQQETQFEDMNQNSEELYHLDHQQQNKETVNVDHFGLVKPANIEQESQNQKFIDVGQGTEKIGEIIEIEDIEQATRTYVDFDQPDDDGQVQTELFNQEPQQEDFKEFVPPSSQQKVIEPIVEKIDDWNQQSKPKSNSQVNDQQQVSQKEDLQDLDEENIDQFDQKENYWNQQNNMQSPVVHNKENILELVPEREEVEDLEQNQQRTEDGSSIEQLFGHENMLQNQHDDIIEQATQLEDEIDADILKQLAQQEHSSNNQQHQVDQYNKLEGKEDDFSDTFNEETVTHHRNHHEPVFVETPVEEKPTPKPQGFFGKIWSKAKDKAKAIVHKVHEHVG